MPAANKLSILAMVTSVTALTLAATDIYLPALLDMAENLATSHGSMQDTISFYFLTFALGQLIIGPLSDRFGRRAVMIVSQSLFLIGTIAAAWAASIEMFLLTRILQATGACAGNVLGRAIIKETFGKEQVVKAMTIMGMIMSLAPAMAPLVGTLLHTHFGWRAIFIFLALCIALVTTVVYFFLPETHHQRATRLSLTQTSTDYGMLLRSRTYMRYVLTLALLNSGLYAIIISSPFVFMENYHMSEGLYSVTYSLHVLMFIAGAAIAASRSKQLGLDRTIHLGTKAAALNGLILLILCLWPQPPLFLVLPGTITFCTMSGFVFPSCNVSAIMVHEHIGGTASAMLSFMLYGMGALVGIAISTLGRGNASPLPMILAIGSVSVLSALSFRLLGEKVGK